MPRKVCIVSSGNLASNPRLLKEADALHEAGYAVTAVVCDYTVSLAADAYGGPAQALRHALRDLPADLYIAHYVPALPAAAFAARRHGGMLGFDAEDFHAGEGTGGAGEDFRMAMVRFIERACLPHCAHMTAASPLIGEAYKSLYGVSSTTVLNVFPLEMSRASAKPC